MYTKEERRKNFQNEKKYTEIEIDYILDLEMIADNLNDFVINNKEEIKEKDFTTEINLIKDTQNKNFSDNILSYSEYLLGAILSFHKEIKDENYTYDGFEKIIKEDCWINLLKNNPDIENIENIEFINSDTNLIIADFIKNSKYPWALATGITHSYYIRDYNKKHTDKKYIKRFYL